MGFIYEGLKCTTNVCFHIRSKFPCTSTINRFYIGLYSVTESVNKICFHYGLKTEDTYFCVECEV